MRACVCVCVFLHIYVLRGFTHLSVPRRICSLLCLLSSMRRSKSSSMMPKRISSLSHWNMRFWDEIMCATVSTIQSVNQSLISWFILDCILDQPEKHSFQFQRLMNLNSSSRSFYSFVRFKLTLTAKKKTKFNKKKQVQISNTSKYSGPPRTASWHGWKNKKVQSRLVYNTLAVAEV